MNWLVESVDPFRSYDKNDNVEMDGYDIANKWRRIEQHASDNKKKVNLFDQPGGSKLLDYLVENIDEPIFHNNDHGEKCIPFSEFHYGNEKSPNYQRKSSMANVYNQPTVGSLTKHLGRCRHIVSEERNSRRTEMRNSYDFMAHKGEELNKRVQKRKPLIVNKYSDAVDDNDAEKIAAANRGDFCDATTPIGYRTNSKNISTEFMNIFPSKKSHKETAGEDAEYDRRRKFSVPKQRERRADRSETISGMLRPTDKMFHRDGNDARVTRCKCSLAQVKNTNNECTKNDNSNYVQKDLSKLGIPENTLTQAWSSFYNNKSNLKTKRLKYDSEATDWSNNENYSPATADKKTSFDKEFNWEKASIVSEIDEDYADDEDTLPDSQDGTKFEKLKGQRRRVPTPKWKAWKRKADRVNNRGAAAAAGLFVDDCTLLSSTENINRQESKTITKIESVEKKNVTTNSNNNNYKKRCLQLIKKTGMDHSFESEYPVLNFTNFQKRKETCKAKREDNCRGSYVITTLTDEVCAKLVKKFLKKEPQEIAFIIIYGNEFNIAKAYKKELKSKPRGIFISFWYEHKQKRKYYFMPLSIREWITLDNPRSFIITCFKRSCRKICYETKQLFLLLMNSLNISERNVSLQWNVYDLMVGCWLINPDSPPDTPQSALTQLLGENAFKIVKGDEMQKACCTSRILSKGIDKMLERIERMNLWQVFHDMETKIISILAAMEYRGIFVKENTLRNLGRTLLETEAAAEKKAHEIVGKAFDINSTKQLRDILYGKLKLDVMHKIDVRKTLMLGEKSTSEATLQQLRKYHPLPGCILEYRHLHKAKSVYIDPMLERIRKSTIHTTWEQTRTATGRLSSCQPNMQTVPKNSFALQLFPENTDFEPEHIHLRAPYVSRSGHSFLSADFKQIEFRIFAHLTQDPTLLKVFKSHEDVFSSIAKTWNEDGEPQIIREQTKKLVYSVMYGVGPGKLSEHLCVSCTEAYEIMHKFLKTFPGIREYSRRIALLCKSQGYLCSISGRRRMFPLINSSDMKEKKQAERQAVNFTIQGSAADVCKAAMIHTESELQSREHLRCHLVLQIHDELVWEVPDEQVKEVTELIRKIMNDEEVSYCKAFARITVPLPVSMKGGKCWANMKEI